MSYRGMQNNEFALTNDIVGVITMSFLHSLFSCYKIYSNNDLLIGW